MAKFLGYKDILTILPFRDPASPGIIPAQLSLYERLPKVIGNVDYALFEKELRRIEELLVTSGTETVFVLECMADFEKAALASRKTPTRGQLRVHQEKSRKALRCEVLRALLGHPSLRVMSRRLAECPLFRIFCGIGQLEVIRVATKSTLQRFSTWGSEATMRKTINSLLAMASREEGAVRMNLEGVIELNLVLMDTTCLKANIHFPVDWVLMRDAVRTLMKATKLIREKGICERMEAPESFLSRMNKLCIEMAQTRRKEGGEKMRKAVLREMKRLAKTTGQHAKRHRDGLDKAWERTGWTRAQADVVIRRIDSVLEQLPSAIKQAHERIIGERPVPSAEKVLSLYEKNVQIIVRGKAGAEVEFGNTLFIAEQENGLIVDYELIKGKTPGDPALLRRSTKRIGEIKAGTIRGIGTDRGFQSEENSRLLEAKEIFDGTCPRDPGELAERCEKDEVFVASQKRRAQTEARIAILKNAFLDGQPRVRGYENRRAATEWAVLAHNLRVMAKLPKRKVKGAETKKEKIPPQVA
jgi:hypothetical protein